MKTTVITLLVLFSLLPVWASAQSSEYLIKAAFLERFTHYVDWPESSDISDTNKPFILGVIGDNPFEDYLEQNFSEIKIKNKQVEIRFYNAVEEIEECNLLFVSQSEKKRIPEIIAFTKNKSILTVSDSKGFAERGILINMYVLNHEIRFEINEKAVNQSDLLVNYLLYSSAKIINKQTE